MAWYKYTEYLGEKYNLLVACFDTFPVGFMGYGVWDGGKADGLSSYRHKIL